jgi:hypothetical protein
MFETDGLPHDFAERCNGMDEVWVPTEFNVNSFAAAGGYEGLEGLATFRLRALGLTVESVGIILVVD